MEKYVRLNPYVALKIPAGIILLYSIQGDSAIGSDCRQQRCGPATYSNESYLRSLRQCQNRRVHFATMHFLCVLFGVDSQNLVKFSIAFIFRYTYQVIHFFLEGGGGSRREDRSVYQILNGISTISIFPKNRKEVSGGFISFPVQFLVAMPQFTFWALFKCPLRSFVFSVQCFFGEVSF